jgi:hypothetical protein
VADTISRQQATDSETPDFHKRLEQLTGGPIILIVVVVDQEGLSVVGNTMPEGMSYYLEKALIQINSGAEPVITEFRDGKAN